MEVLPLKLASKTERTESEHLVTDPPENSQVHTLKDN